MSDRVKWETTFIVLQGRNAADQNVVINKMGNDGWELVTITVYTFEQQAWFKRPRRD